MIFNKNSNGSEEFKALLGFIYASNSYNNLLTYIDFAKKDVIRIVGPEIFKIAEDHYNSDDYQTTDPVYVLLDELVKRVQLPVALHAYRRYAPGNDITHSDAGRQILVTDTEKPAFEWMIDKDNYNLLSLANDSIELLLDFLDAQLIVIEPGELNHIAEIWNSSAAYKLMKSTFVNSVDQYEYYIPINSSRRLFMILSPFIRKVEMDLIRGIITRSRYDGIIEAIKDGQLTEEQTEIRRLASGAIVMKSMAKALKLIPSEILPDAFAKRFAEEKNSSIDTDSRLGSSQVLENEGNSELLKLQRYIKSITPVTEEVIPDEIDPTKPYFMF